MKFSNLQFFFLFFGNTMYVFRVTSFYTGTILDRHFETLLDQMKIYTNIFFHTNMCRGKKSFKTIFVRGAHLIFEILMFSNFLRIFGSNNAHFSLLWWAGLINPYTLKIKKFQNAGLKNSGVKTGHLYSVSHGFSSSFNCKCLNIITMYLVHINAFSWTVQNTNF